MRRKKDFIEKRKEGASKVFSTCLSSHCLSRFIGRSGNLARNKDIRFPPASPVGRFTQE